ncbi:PaaI family thioesterase [Oleiphilus sp. HI0125]|uniref:PaaI family thioesterase n=1 Tax=Oleiphilus sp. HI0125 TaxID=1822266 RepID=UPI0008396269|nr:PaaI family thioesterase [Oleiphilus sp. HI0125]
MRDESILLGQVEGFISVLAQCQALGITVASARENELILELPYTEKIIGNPDTGVIHGGAITTLMDTAAGAGVLCALPEFELCPTLDLRVDYMRSARPDQPVYARASCYRVTKNIVFMRCEAYQVDRTVAHCVATFMRMGAKGIPSLEHMTKGTQIPEFTFNENTRSQVSLKDLRASALATKDFEPLISAIPYASYIGVELDGEPAAGFYKLNRQPSNIGNPILPAIHGGVLGGFMEMASMLHLLATQPGGVIPRIIDFSIDYLRAGLDRDTFVHCEVTCQGGRVANVEVHAWQQRREKPIALARAHFLLE